MRASWAICAFVAFGMAVGCAVIASGAISALHTYTPVFQAVKCIPIMGNSTAKPIIDFASDTVTLNTLNTVQCQNPNPYSMYVQSVGAGKVTGVEAREDIGSSFAPLAILPSKGSGSMHVNITVRVNMSQLMTFLALDTIHIVTEMEMESTIAISFFGRSKLETKSQLQICGSAFRLSKRKQGPPACAAARESLRIPDVESEPAQSVISLSEEDLREAENSKNLFFGCLLGISTALSLAFLASAVMLYRRARKPLIETEKSAEHKWSFDLKSLPALLKEVKLEKSLDQPYSLGAATAACKGNLSEEHQANDKGLPEDSVVNNLHLIQLSIDEEFISVYLGDPIAS